MHVYRYVGFPSDNSSASTRTSQVSPFQSSASQPYIYMYKYILNKVHVGDICMHWFYTCTISRRKHVFFIRGTAKWQAVKSSPDAGHMHVLIFST